MSDFVAKNMGGSVFKNKYKTLEKHPYYTGDVKVDNVDYKLAMWIKVDKNGQQFFSCGFQKADQDNRSNSSQRQNTTPIDLDDDIAF